MTEIVKSEMNFESKTTVGRDFTLSQIEGFHILPDYCSIAVIFLNKYHWYWTQCTCIVCDSSILSLSWIQQINVIDALTNYINISVLDWQSISIVKLSSFFFFENHSEN